MEFSGCEQGLLLFNLILKIPDWGGSGNVMAKKNTDFELFRDGIDFKLR
jgi:hypothetical protein